MENEIITCQMCKKERVASEEFPEWCVSCAEKYGDYTDERPLIDKIRRRRSERDE